MPYKVTASALEILHNALVSSTIAYFAYDDSTLPFRWKGDMDTEIVSLRPPPEAKVPPRLQPTDGYSKIFISMEFPSIKTRNAGLAGFPCITIARGEVHERALAFRRSHALTSDFTRGDKGVMAPHGGMIFADVLWEIATLDDPNKANQLAGLIHEGLVFYPEQRPNSIFSNLVRLGVLLDSTDIIIGRATTDFMITGRPLWTVEIRADIMFDWRVSTLEQRAASVFEYEAHLYSVLPFGNDEFLIKRYDIDGETWLLVEKDTDLYNEIKTEYYRLEASDELIYRYIEEALVQSSTEEQGNNIAL